MKIHLIAVGGSIMHNLAIALHKKGYQVSGSDDQIYEPARSRLESYGLLPEPGWKEENISPDIDIVILGMHAKADNPELKKAQDLGLKIVSFPEFIYNESKEKTRVVIAGSHGKTTVTSMVMHVLKKCGKNFDYAVGSTIAGFEDSVKLSKDAPVMIIEGDEYLSSALDRRPKFMWYDPDVTLLNGIAWDHINVFPTYEIYVEQFENLLKSMRPGTKLVYYAGDKEVDALADKTAGHLKTTAYSLPGYTQKGELTSVNLNGEEYLLSVFGKHNLQNLAGAQKVCEQLGIKTKEFWSAAADYKGAGKRLERVPNNKNLIVFRDFAHSPSKVKASVEAVKEQYSDKELVAVLELHTYSSLNKDFINEYAHTLDPADIAIVYIDNEALKLKGAIPYTKEQITTAFQREDIAFIENGEELQKLIKNSLFEDKCLLMMSSGNLGGTDIKFLLQ